MPAIVKCVYCGKDFKVKLYKADTAKYCSKECMNAARKGQKHEDKWIEKVCPSCGEPFSTLKSKEKKYCSEKCRLEHKEFFVSCNCDACGKEITVPKIVYNKKLSGEQKSISCSRNCANLLKKKGIEIQCDNCGKVIYRTPYRLELREHQFCSIPCQKEFEHKESFEIRNCEICGSPFECSKISTQRFCSNECQGKWQSTQVGELNSRIKRSWIQCDYCGKEILMQDYRIEQNEYCFCNEECRRKWYSEFYSQSPEWKQKSRERALRMLSDGVFSHTDTKPQLIVNELLDRNNIIYKNEYNIKYFAIDNYLSEYKLFIEVMGDYWHSNPMKYKLEDLSQTQRERAVKDRAKHTYVKNNYGEEILYLWESDLYNNVELCDMLIQLYINNHGVLLEYHSINYYLDDNVLKRLDNRYIPFQEQKIKYAS